MVTMSYPVQYVLKSKLQLVFLSVSPLQEEVVEKSELWSENKMVQWLELPRVGKSENL
jgi:hypothetical protein